MLCFHTATLTFLLRVPASCFTPSLQPANRISQCCSQVPSLLGPPCLLQVREITANVGEGEKRWTLSGVLALQEAAEAYLVGSWRRTVCMSL